jgi:hypothetical protein
VVTERGEGKKGIRTGRDEEGEWESEKILIKNVCSVEQWITIVGYLLFTIKEKWLK